jgi:hypothetical protein
MSGQSASHDGAIMTGRVEDAMQSRANQYVARAPSRFLSGRLRKRQRTSRGECCPGWNSSLRPCFAENCDDQHEPPVSLSSLTRPRAVGVAEIRHYACRRGLGHVAHALAEFRAPRVALLPILIGWDGPRPTARRTTASPAPRRKFGKIRQNSVTVHQISNYPPVRFTGAGARPGREAKRKAVTAHQIPHYQPIRSIASGARGESPNSGNAVTAYQIPNYPVRSAPSGVRLREASIRRFVQPCVGARRTTSILVVSNGAKASFCSCYVLSGVLCRPQPTAITPATAPAFVH